MLIVGDAWVELIETALLTGAVAPDLGTAKVDLFKNPWTPGRQDAMSNYTLGNFTGYAQSNMTPTGPYPDQVNGPFLRSALQHWQVSATPTVTNPQIFGYVISDGSGGFIAAEAFVDAVGNPAPVPMVAPNTPLALVIEFRLRDYTNL